VRSVQFLQQRVVFALSGAFAGTLLVIGESVHPLTLVFGVGPLIVGSCALAAASQGIRLSTIRVASAMLLSIPAYFVAFFSFAATISFFQQHGVRASSLISDVGPDVVLGLAAAVIVAGLLLEGLAFLLSGRWSTITAIGLGAAGIASVGCTYLARLLYWQMFGPPKGLSDLFLFFGPLFIFGGGMTTLIIGEQMNTANRVLRSASS
jgi:hypothetical protein